jgi:hypothetical protein
MTDFLINYKVDLGVIGEFKLMLGSVFKEHQQDNNRGFIIDESGLEETVLGDLEFRVIADDIAVLDAEFLHVFLRMDKLIEPDLKVIDIAGFGVRIWINVGGRGGGEDGSGIDLAIAGIDFAVFAV